jgi:hypothetical protein
MKTYFTKLLPVDGGIAPGDSYLFEPAGEVLVCQDQEEADRCNNHTIIKRGSTKLGLFICSRLIMVGDILKECLPDNQPQRIHHFETVLPYGVFVFEP